MYGETKWQLIICTPRLINRGHPPLRAWAYLNVRNEGENWGTQSQERDKLREERKEKKKKEEVVESLGKSKLRDKHTVWIERVSEGPSKRVSKASHRWNHWNYYELLSACICKVLLVIWALYFKYFMYVIIWLHCDLHDLQEREFIKSFQENYK